MSVFHTLFWRSSRYLGLFCWIRIRIVFSWIRIRIKVHPGSGSGTNFFTFWIRIRIRIKMIRIRNTAYRYCAKLRNDAGISCCDCDNTKLKDNEKKKKKDSKGADQFLLLLPSSTAILLVQRLSRLASCLWRGIFYLSEEENKMQRLSTPQLPTLRTV